MGITMALSDSIFNMKPPLSLYVHIPFCQVKCPYCDFYSLAKAEDSIQAYTRVLLEEIAYFARAAARRHRVETVFFGGGTPSHIPAGHIERIVDALREHFDVDDTAEITLEMNPGSCETAKLGEYRRMGINRISLGIQSFHDDELKFLGRVHDAGQAHAAINAVRDAGFANFSMDFIFGLPGQSRERWDQTLTQALAYDPPHLSAYNLTYEEGTLLYQQKKAGQVKPLPDDLELELFLLARRKLAQAGLAQYEISNYAKAGFEARHNLVYWNGKEYLGFGAGGHSFFDGKRFSKQRSLSQYLANTSAEAVAIIADEELSLERRFWEILAIGLRDLRGVPLAKLSAQWGVPAPDERSAKLAPWLDEGLLQIHQGYLRLTQRGVLYYDRVAAGLI